MTLKTIPSFTFAEEPDVRVPSGLFPSPLRKVTVKTQLGPAGTALKARKTTSELDARLPAPQCCSADMCPGHIVSR